MITELYNFLSSWLWSEETPVALQGVAPQLTLLFAVVGGAFFLWLILKLIFGGLYAIINAMRG